jgi:hypothetical protein
VLSTPRGNDSADVYPMAVAAIPRCQASGCSGAWMAMAADFEAGGDGAVRWNQEAYVNALGDGAAWSSSWSTSETSAIETSAVGAWGSVTAPRVVLVGSGGLLVHGVGSGGTMTWTRLTGVEGLASRNFTGVAVAGDTVLVSATRTSGSEVVYELWAMPTSGQGGLASTWKIHEILRASAVEAAGLYDVDGRSGGEVMAVGSVRRTDGSTWLDGLVLRRSGD